MDAATSRTSTGDAAPRDLEVESLTDYCSRPKCRTEFRRQGGRGRRQNTVPISAAEQRKKVRQTKSRLEHFEASGSEASR